MVWVSCRRNRQNSTENWRSIWNSRAFVRAVDDDNLAGWTSGCQAMRHVIPWIFEVSNKGVEVMSTLHAFTGVDPLDSTSTGFCS